MLLVCFCLFFVSRCCQARSVISSGRAAWFLLKSESRLFSLRTEITILSLKENKSLVDVIEIRSVTLRCSNDAKGLVCKLFLLTHCRKVLSVLHDEMSIFSAWVRHYSRRRHHDFPQRCSFFILTCKMRLQPHQLNWLLPSSCLSTRDIADAVSGYCSSGEWQQSDVNEEEQWERWLSCLVESLANLWLDCWINCMFHTVWVWQSIWSVWDC